jgi:hypothetical protein
VVVEAVTRAVSVLREGRAVVLKVFHQHLVLVHQTKVSVAVIIKSRLLHHSQPVVAVALDKSAVTEVAQHQEAVETAFK